VLRRAIGRRTLAMRYRTQAAVRIWWYSRVVMIGCGHERSAGFEKTAICRSSRWPASSRQTYVAGKIY
jgi:hypothetical protein